MQARMEAFSSNVTGTVITDIVVKLKDIPEVQVEAGSEQLNLYVDGVHHELDVGDSPIIVSSAGVLSNNLTGGIGGVNGSMMRAMRDEIMFLRMDRTNSLALGIGDGGSVTISLQTNFLALSLALPDTYTNLTSGLLGFFNGDPDDDFRDRNGEVLNLSTEEEIYEQFGLLCK